MSFAAGAACLAFEANVFHFLLQSERREGRSAESIQAARDMVAHTSEDMLREMSDFDAVLAMPILMEARFGHWDKVLAALPAPEGMAFPAAMRRYARGLGAFRRRSLGALQHRSRPQSVPRLGR